VVDEIDDSTCSSIPPHSFEFVDFEDVPARNGNKRFFTGTWLGELTV
jgi:replication factor A1